MDETMKMMVPSTLAEPEHFRATPDELLEEARVVARLSEDPSALHFDHPSSVISTRNSARAT
jgi:hypothetical protein